MVHVGVLSLDRTFRKALPLSMSLDAALDTCTALSLGFSFLQSSFFNPSEPRVKNLIRHQETQFLHQYKDAGDDLKLDPPSNPSHSSYEMSR